jgi:hypothetical protein
MKAAFGKRGGPAQQKREQAVIREIAEAFALGMTAGVIASGLNERRHDHEPRPAPGGGTWSRKQVERTIAAHPRAMQRAKQRREQERTRTAAMVANSRTVVPALQDEERYLIGEHDNAPEPVRPSPYEGLTWSARQRVEQETRALEERCRLAQQAATLARFDLDVDFRFYDPVRLLDSGRFPTYPMLDAHDRIGKLKLAGEDTWPKAVDALVAELTRNTGKNAHELLDAITGQPDVRAQLRRVVYGLMREIALQRQANLALRQQLGQTQPVQREPAPTLGAVETWLQRVKDHADEEWQRIRHALDNPDG